MAVQKNFLLGYGERLTEPVKMAGRPVEKRAPYTFDEARDALAPMLASTTESLAALPDDACPADEAVAIITLHPQYLAKSYFPSNLLRGLGLQAIGSRPRQLKPRKWTKAQPLEVVETTEVFVAGSRDAFDAWRTAMPTWTPERGHSEICHVEAVRAPVRADRIRVAEVKGNGDLVLEAVLHVPSPQDEYILQGFGRYLADLEAEPDFDRRLHAGGLCFLPISASRKAVEQIADFSFLRTIRPIPQIRLIDPVVRSVSYPKRKKPSLPTDVAVVSEGVRMAVFDGGLPTKHPFGPWVTVHEPAGIGAPVDEFLEHGLHVTGAALFGSLVVDRAAERPYCKVDHYRVLDEKSRDDPYELYDVLMRIREVLQTRRFKFVNLSIGPFLPIEDDDVHTWTAVLDDLLSSGDVLVATACGNTGERDWAAGNARVQVPSDLVNGLAVGAATTSGPGWARAPYSSVGPGRSPGLVKPDVLSFGGSDVSPFLVLHPKTGEILGTQGTSFSTPNLLRLGVGLAAHFGDLLSPLAIKALLVHGAEEGVSRRECGWGRTPADLDSLVSCPDGAVRVVYQGELTAGQVIRAEVPTPRIPIPGNITIRATLAYATEVDPQDPGNYTRAGLDVVFRPDETRFDREDQTHPKTRAFFQLRDFSTEQELRRDAHKWETILHKQDSMRGTTLSNPRFDIHYVARAGGAQNLGAGKIRYAMVVSVTAPRMTEIYDRVVERYRNVLVPLRPQVEIPVRV